MVAGSNPARGAVAYARKEDQAAAAKRHYEANRQIVKDRAKAWTDNQRIILRKYVRELKLSSGCMDCGGMFDVPEVLEFDHVGEDKDRAVAILVGRGISLARLQAEIAKCEIVCANCHRIRTVTRRGVEQSGSSSSS